MVPQERHFNSIQQIEQIKPIGHVFIECILYHMPCRHDLRVGARTAILQFVWSFEFNLVAQRTCWIYKRLLSNKFLSELAGELIPPTTVIEEGKIELECAAPLFPVSTVYRL